MVANGLLGSLDSKHAAFLFHEHLFVFAGQRFDQVGEFFLELLEAYASSFSCHNFINTDDSRDFAC